MGKLEERKEALAVFEEMLDAGVRYLGSMLLILLIQGATVFES